MIYRQLLRRLLFRMEPERAHRSALAALAMLETLPGGLAVLRREFGGRDPLLAVEAFGLRFPSPVGLAAGFDKNARAVRALAALGFGAVEVGGVTAAPRAGNPRPRIRRLPREQAIINWMGLPNDGAAAIAPRLAALHTPEPLEARLGLNVAGDTVEAYLRVLRACGPSVDYVTLNVSCPNVPAACQLADPGQVRALLAAVREEPALRGKPALLKISPDLAGGEVAELVDLALDGGAAGIVATNTSARLALEVGAGRGGLSGAPLRERSLAVVRQVRRRAGDRLAVVAAGGIFTPAHALEAILAGASLVQVYTGLIYHGPAITRDLNQGLAALLKERGFHSVAEAVGAEREKGGGREECGEYGE